MNTIELSLVQEDEPCGYVCTKEEYLDLIIESCGCKPSKWDGCKVADILPQINDGRNAVVKGIKSLDDLELGAPRAEVFMFFNTIFMLGTMHPEARVEVRY